MFANLVLSVTVFVFGILGNVTKLSVRSQSMTENVTLYPPRRQSTALIVSDVNDVHIVMIMAQQAELPVSFEVVKPALQLAIEKVQNFYPHIRFRLVARKDDKPCVSNVAGAIAAEEFYLRKVSAFIGPSCSLALDPVARMASYWNVPIFTAGGIGIEFSRKNIYTSLTRMTFSLGMSDWNNITVYSFYVYIL